MFFIVKLKWSNHAKIIPSKWVQSLQLEKLLTYGIAYEKRKVQKVFISPADLQAEPDFKLPVLNEYDRYHDACYLVHIVQLFGKDKFNSR